MTIIIIHDYNKVIEIKGVVNTIGFDNMPIAQVMILLAKKYPDALLVWCHLDVFPNLNSTLLNNIFCKKRMIASFSNSNEHYLTSSIGYIDQMPFVKVVRDKRYPTFLMSTIIGGIFSETLLKFKGCQKSDFGYFLNSIAKIGQPKGLFCYSDPRFIKGKINCKIKTISIRNLFAFVAQHYSIKKVFLLFFCFVFYEQKCPIIPFLLAFLRKQNYAHCERLNEISLKGSLKDFKEVTEMDVIIPTIGRKEYLINVLEDLAQQSWRPKTVIVVEQNPDFSSKSELEDLNKIQWPFKLDLNFTHKAGVCSARNTALSKVTADWVFLADDDNRLQPELLATVKSKIEYFQVNVLNPAYLQLNESEPLKIEKQWETFGAGCSFMASRLLKEVQFDLGFEFGYAEDKDFGAQLRNNGSDILYDPNIKILHLKAPIGGFRFEHSYPWQKEKYTPKPSPTIMLHSLKNKTREQFLGFKLVYFLQRLSGWQSILRINSIFKEWNCSLKWATHLKND
ncbi:glycosyltransferase family A protein [Croceibacter atlanticus]|uniref:glycosyltransferase family 2 protein n=1 Tax=Croceibacter atlanticus TaxID=313588 RepID=UPI0030F6532C